MKKTYINPTMDIIEIEMQTIIAASVGFGSDSQPGGAATGREFDDDELFDLISDDPMKILF